MGRYEKLTFIVHILFIAAVVYKYMEWAPKFEAKFAAVDSALAKVQTMTEEFNGPIGTLRKVSGDYSAADWEAGLDSLFKMLGVPKKPVKPPPILRSSYRIGRA
jgi:hypothetical protein